MPGPARRGAPLLAWLSNRVPARLGHSAAHWTPGAKVARSVTHGLDDPPGRPREQVLADEGVELPVQNGLGIAHLVAGAGIFHELIRVEDVGANGLPAESGVGGATPFLRQKRL